jgi:flagellar biosynthetic protein FliO
MMNKFVLWTVLVLGSAGAAFGQTAAKPTATVGPAPAASLAPLPDEKSLTITDTTPATTNTTATPPADITVWDFLKMFLILALVIGMIVGFLWFLRRLSGQGPTSDAPIRVLHTHTLGGNRNLQVVDVGGQVLLLGTGDGGVRLVKDLTGTEAADAFQLEASKGPGRGGKQSFGDLVGTLMGVKPKIRPDIGEPGENSSDFLKKQRERLKNL